MDKHTRRLQELADLLGKYAHRWNATPSQRMMGWVDEYNGIKADHPAAWRAYCESTGACTTHHAYDCLA